MHELLKFKESSFAYVVTFGKQSLKTHEVSMMQATS
jgi:hypothetical protein